MADRILVTCATGKVGRELVKKLLARGETVRAATRFPGAAHDLFSTAVEIVEFDFEATPTWDAAVEWVDRAFLMPPPFDPHADETIRSFMDWAVTSGVRKVVLNSAMDVENVPDLALHRLEQHLEHLDVMWVILRPNLYMQNFAGGFLLEGARNGAIELCAADGRVSFVDSRDVSAAAALALCDDAHDHESWTLTGPEPLGLDEVAACIAAEAGYPIEYRAVEEERIREILTRRHRLPGHVEMALALFRTVAQGHREAVRPDLMDLLDRPATPFRTFAAEHGEVWRQP